MNKTLAGFLLLFALLVGVALLTTPHTPPADASAAGSNLAASSNTWVVWEALNVVDQLFVDPASIMQADDCTCNYPCGGLCPPCTAVRRAIAMGPYCSEAEAWGNVCARMSDRGRYVIGSPCPWWVIVDGVKHTVSWNPWTECPKIGGEVVIPHPTCVVPIPTATATATATPTPEWDIQIGAVEITQAVQCLDQAKGDKECPDNSVELVWGKSIEIRVYPLFKVLSGPTPTAKEKVDAMLLIDSPGSGAFLPGTDPPMALYLPAELPIDRDGFHTSINFRLPGSWVTEPEIRLHIILNDEHAVPETDYENNRTDLTLTFGRFRDLTVVYVPIEYQPIGQQKRAPDEEPMVEAASLAEAVYPVRDGGFYYRRGKTVTFREVLSGGIDNDGRFRRYLNILYWAPRIRGAGKAPDQLFGWLPYFSNEWAIGAADTLDAEPMGYGKVAYGTAWDDLSFLTGISPEHLLAHEVGHNYMGVHPGTADACGADNYLSPNPWPYPNATIQETGYDTSVMDKAGAYARVGSTTKDLMSYCPSPWVSPYTYGNLQYGIGGVGTSTAPLLLAAPQEYVLISGAISDTGVASLDPLQRISGSEAITAPAQGHDYCLVFEDSRRQELSRYCFDVAFADHTGKPLRQKVFFYILPFPAGTRARHDQAGEYSDR